MENSKKKPARERVDKKERGGQNATITEAMYKKELERLNNGVDLLGESRRHG